MEDLEVDLWAGPSGIPWVVIEGLLLRDLCMAVARKEEYKKNMWISHKFITFGKTIIICILVINLIIPILTVSLTKLHLRTGDIALMRPM